ncbi:hypothetical protein EG329_008419 [Mollisiaceae sp. DMI_Dod_QoI]|nr:hypothetical protein EG329_008419 [Helotiales sp. DMI_Dod_QoI]
METPILVNPLQSKGAYLYEPLTDIRLEEDVFEYRPPSRSEDLEEDSVFMDCPEETLDQTSHSNAYDEAHGSQEGLRRKLKAKWNRVANKLHPRRDIEPGTDFRNVGPQDLSDTYITRSVKDDWDQIRLIELLPGGFKDAIKCRMHCRYVQHVGTSMWWPDAEYPESNPPKYEALSYAWGDSLSMESIYINDQSLSVRSNLATILRYLRKKKVSRILWIDAICINQNDVAEKNVQVQRMVQIYRQASSVLVWLGESTDTSDLAFKTIEALGGAEKYMVREPIIPNFIDGNGERWPLRPENESKLKSWKSITEAQKDSLLHLFTRHSWWTRMWIVQEITYPPTARLICGHRSMIWDSLESMFTRAEVVEPFLSHSTVFGLAMENLGLAMGKVHALTLLRSRAQACEELMGFRDRSTSLRSLAMENIDRSATDPRDMIFALLGLSSCPNSVTVNYSTSVRDIYIKATRAMIIDATEDGGRSSIPSLNIICTAYRSELPSDHGLPSWVPDFSRAPDFGKIMMQMIESACTNNERACYNAMGDKGVLTFSPIFEPRDVLCARGVLLDDLLTVNGPLLGDFEDHWDPNIWEPAVPDEDMYPHTSEPSISAFWKTLLFGQGEISGRRLTVDEEPQFLSEFLWWSGRERLEPAQEQEARSKSKHEKWHGVYDRFRPALRGLGSEQDHNRDSRGKHERWSGVFDRLQNTLRGYTFSTSRNGYYAMVPTTSQPGDVVMVSRGLSVPVILRRVEDNTEDGEGDWEETERYVLVGPAYVHGVMDGEIARGIEAGLLLVRETTEGELENYSYRLPSIFRADVERTFFSPRPLLPSTSLLTKMDPLTALSLAGNVIQFVDFGTKLLAGTYVLYKSNTGDLETMWNAELYLVTCDLEDIITRFHQPLSPMTASGATINHQSGLENLESICKGAAKVAKELKERLESIRVRGPGKYRVWNSFAAAVMSAWSKDEIDELTKRLSSFKDAIATRVLMSIRESMEVNFAQTTAHLKSLDNESRRIATALLGMNSVNSIQREMHEQTFALAQLLSRMESSNQAEHQQTRAALLQTLRSEKHSQQVMRLQRCGDDRSLTELQEDWDNTNVKAVNQVLDNTKDRELLLWRSAEKHILESLRPTSLHRRYEEITETYPKTFKWVFESPTASQRPWSNFTEWLENGDGIYWINGKAGSGKSTLMKYIYDEPRVRQHLHSWAKNTPLCIATFFFWNSGTLEQQSQSGLLRALLFEVLSQFPDLIPVVLPSVWGKTYSAMIQKSNVYGERWPLQRLMTSFTALTRQTSISLKLCLFIDGLDEYGGDHPCEDGGDHHQIAELFKNIAFSPFLKVCLSSRPLVVFAACFKDCSTLRLQDLTAGDIKHFVIGRFNSDSAFQALSSREPDFAADLILEIVEKAEGLFLWVRLVVKSLLDGIRNCDTISDLQKRLQRLPKELTPLYKHLQSQIDDVYLEWASKAFQLSRASRECMFDWLERESPLSLVDVYLGIDAEGATVEDVQEFTESKMMQIYQDTHTRLTARCAGLLEAREVWDSEDSFGCGIQRLDTNTTVRYLHRTARDYIENPKTWAGILQHTENHNFQPPSILVRSSVLQMWMRYSTRRRHAGIWRVLIHSYYADQIMHQSHALLLDQFEQRLNSFEMFHSEHWTADFVASETQLKNPFLAFAALFELTTYVREKLDSYEKQDAYLMAQSILNFLQNCRKIGPNEYPFQSEKMKAILRSYESFSLSCASTSTESTILVSGSEICTSKSRRSWFRRNFRRS